MISQSLRLKRSFKSSSPQRSRGYSRPKAGRIFKNDNNCRYLPCTRIQEAHSSRRQDSSHEGERKQRYQGEEDTRKTMCSSSSEHDGLLVLLSVPVIDARWSEVVTMDGQSADVIRYGYHHRHWWPVKVYLPVKVNLCLKSLMLDSQLM